MLRTHGRYEYSNFSDREHFYGDPDFVDVPIDTLLSKSYTRARRQCIDMHRAVGAMPPTP